jgi:parallel beta-helix repeat protein
MHGGNLNVIELNHLHDLSIETEDTGAIYCGGRDWITPRGSVIRHNWIHDVYGMDLHNGKLTTPHFSWGIYLDDNSGGVDVIGNVVERCGRGGIHVHGARDCWILNNIWAGNRQWQVDMHGWSVSDRYTRSLPAMIEGYEKVSAEPAWQKLRGMELHPKDAPLPDGLTMRGNRFERNILVSSDPEVPVIDVRQVPFRYNAFDFNVYWAPGGRIKTGFLGAGAAIGPELIGPWKGEPEKLPVGWRWSGKPSEPPKGGLRLSEKEGLVFRIEGIRKPYVVASGSSMVLEAGAAYRLTARVRASNEAKAVIGVQSFVAGEYFWMSPKSEVRVSTDWEDREWVFTVPVQGQSGWHPKMSTFSARLEWRSEEGWIDLAGMALQKVEIRSEWESWRDHGIDQGSLVADPKFEGGDPRRLAEDSPAWALGFERIPFEEIGLYPDYWRSGLFE